MSGEQTFKKAVDMVGVIKNSLFILGGLVVAYLGYAEMVTIRIGSLRLPIWSMYVFAALFLGIGLFLVITSIFQEKCVRCNANSEFGELHFAPAVKDELLQAMSSFSLDTIAPSFVSAYSKNITLALRYCPGCKKKAEVTITANEQNSASSKVLMAETIVPEQSVTALVNYVEQYVEDDDE